ncbi:MAG: MBOAT family protein [Clostridia bacterium]|nr:MBOAT family protein [Clostridia bacterium]
MLFNSLSYLIFLPAIALVYFLIPWQKVRNLLLLAGSYYFYMCWDPRFIVLMIGCTLITYLDALFIDVSRREEKEGVPPEKRRTGRAKLYTAVTIVFTLAIVAWFKYANFLTESLVGLLGLVGIQLQIPRLNIALPVGISFFTFQSLSYVIDVYRGKTACERNILRYALFVSFFPQLVAGPIERSSNLLVQFREKHRFSAEQAKHGAMLVLWGFFMKIVVADRVAIVVDQIYNYYASYEGVIPILGTILFAVQIYCDFNGYTTIAIGSAQLMGFHLMKNFEQPYLATSVADFWRRWHISLTSWFRDYIYFPLGGSRCAPWKRYRNIMIVFLVSGLWHGAAWTYIIWGGLNGALQIVGAWLKPFREKVLKKLRVSTGSLGHRLVQILITFVLVDITWVFFRAKDIPSALHIIQSSFTVWNPWVLVDGTLYTLGLEQADFWLMMLSILILAAVDVLHARGKAIWQTVSGWPLPVRWVLIYGLIFWILIFGVYGPAFDATSFIYFQF